MALKIAAWNVNSILARLPTALKVFDDVGADIWCLQEIKCEDARFPRFEFEAMGFNVETYDCSAEGGCCFDDWTGMSDCCDYLYGG